MKKLITLLSLFISVSTLAVTNDIKFIFTPTYKMLGHTHIVYASSFEEWKHDVTHATYRDGYDNDIEKTNKNFKKGKDGKYLLTDVYEESYRARESLREYKTLENALKNHFDMNSSCNNEHDGPNYKAWIMINSRIEFEFPGEMKMKYKIDIQTI